MKKIFLCVILFSLVVFSFYGAKTYAYTEEFSYLLETMEIPSNNVLGKEINEEIYQEYQLFVYGNPLEYYPGQRWKDVLDGHWTKNGTAWRGSGIRGEYWILGTNYNGKEVHNHKFPVDIEPPTKPTEWRYAIIADALESWQQTEKYVDDIQREYMLTQKLMRNDTIYDITVEDIGLSKVRVENYATWKTKGTVYTQRYDINNKKWAANFMVPAMAADASLESYANFPLGTEYTLQDVDNISIPIIYGAQVLNLTDYAKKEHVKEIKSELYINDNYIEEVSNIQALEISKDTMFRVNKNEYANNAMIVLNVKVKSILVTTFITDGPLIDIKEYTIYIKCGEVEEQTANSIYNIIGDENYIRYPEFPPPKITSIEISRIINGKEEELLISKKTNQKFICAGQTIKFKVKAIHIPERVTIEFEGDSSITTFDDLTKRFEWTEPKERGEKTLVTTLKDFNRMYYEKKGMENLYTGKDEEEFEYTYVVPYQTKQTLHSWSTLREISDNAFAIDENRLFSRIKEPYEIVFKVTGPTGKSTKRIKLDVFERWDTLYNRDLSKYIVTNNSF